MASIATNVNDSGQVVGFSNYAYGTDYRGVMWDDNQTHDLNDYLVDAEGFTMQWALGINNAGQIVGRGYQDNPSNARCVLLTPVPEPATIMLVGGGIAALLTRKRRLSGRTD